MIILSCDNHKKVKIKDENDILIKEYHLLNGKRDGIYKEYHNNKKVSLIVNYKDGLKSGKEQSFRDDGSINYISYYRDGKLDTTVNWYDNKNILLRQSNYYNNKLFGFQFSRNDSLSTKQYFFINFEQETIYRLIIDKRNNKISEEGVPIYIVYNKNSLKENQVFNFLIFFDKPVIYSSYVLYYTLNNGESKIINNINKRYYSLFSDRSIYFKYRGKYKLDVFLDCKIGMNKKTYYSGSIDIIVI